jgi:hypothetical protein
VDPESRAYIADHVGQENDIPEALRSRLNGESLAELRADAQAMREQLGIAQEPARQRDQAGRFAKTSSGFSTLIRQAAGYGE